MFRKSKQNIGKRVRQTVIPGSGDTSRAVFSYHASRMSRATDTNAPRTSNKLLWLGTPKPRSPRRPASTWSKRVRFVLIVAVALVMVVYGLTLSRDPQVVTLADARDRQVFLRSGDVYQRGAQAALAGSLANTNKLTIDTASIAAGLEKQFPELEDVTVALPFFGRTPVVYMQPARSALLLKVAEGGVFILDSSGRALINASQVSKVETLGLPVVEDQTGLPITLGAAALPSGNVSFVTEVVGQLKAKQLAITSMVLPKGSSELDIRVSGAPYLVKFNLRGDARAEAGAYLAVKQYLEREHKTPESYVDVRVDNKAYYR